MRSANVDARALARVTRFAALVALAIVAAACSARERSSETPPISPEEHTMLLESDAFQEGGGIPTPYTCDGTNISPQLSWFGVPADAIELALVLHDPDAHGGDFVHWVVFGIDPAQTGIELNKVPAGARLAQNGFGVTQYRGPCPPVGDPPHRYVFTLTALRGRLAFSERAAGEDVQRAIAPLVLDQAMLTGTFGR
jgi:hypothetical protein